MCDFTRNYGSQYYPSTNITNIYLKNTFDYFHIFIIDLIGFS